MTCTGLKAQNASQAPSRFSNHPSSHNTSLWLQQNKKHQPNDISLKHKPHLGSLSAAKILALVFWFLLSLQGTFLNSAFFVLQLRLSEVPFFTVIRANLPTLFPELGLFTTCLHLFCSPVWSPCKQAQGFLFNQLTIDCYSYRSPAAYPVILQASLKCLTGVLPVAHIGEACSHVSPAVLGFLCLLGNLNFCPSRV